MSLLSTVSISKKTHEKLIDFVSKTDRKIGPFADKAISDRIDLESGDLQKVSVDDLIKWKEAFDKINHNNY